MEETDAPSYHDTASTQPRRVYHYQTLTTPCPLLPEHSKPRELEDETLSPLEVHDNSLCRTRLDIPVLVYYAHAMFHHV